MIYPKFKDDRAHDSWYCETHVIASVYGTETIFGPHHSHTEASQALLWVEIKCFMFSVFVRTYKHL